MRCPKCKTVDLKNRTVKGKSVKVDKCPSCDGIWFDKGEISKVLGNAAVQQFKMPEYAAEQKDVKCPRCSVSLYMHAYPGTMTLVDSCKRCYGIWLDDREIKEIYSSSRGNSESLVKCPKCGQYQSGVERCRSCGFVLNGVDGRSIQQRTAKENDSDNHRGDLGDDTDIPGLKGSLLRFVNKTISKMIYTLTG